MQRYPPILKNLKLLFLLPWKIISQDPNFTVYCQDTSQFPEYLDQLAHVHYQKQAFLANAEEFLSEGRAGKET